MAKTITIRLSDEEYEKIQTSAQNEHRPISNFITHSVLKDIETSYSVDPVEMSQIKSDKKLQEKLKKGHNDAKKMKGKLIG
ncbi:MAG: hypothetical protein A2252_11500 [Elusimicrobia bacterium RIFOXYA2_FULL_39_19]|nr:MAG: hypothetical protein A2252_11500 [Elusimicrobia bacterium RIFOXYA2_FULL_39_19]